MAYRIIDEGKVAGKVNFIIALYDAFEDGSVFSLTSPQRLLRLLLLGDVTEKTSKPYRLAL